MHDIGTMSEEDILREIAALLARSRSRTQMVGDALREVGVLLIVFAPLETLFNPGVSSWWATGAIVALGLVAGFLGIALEDKHK